MELEKDLKRLPNSGNHNCFGCSPVNPSGLQMKFYANEDKVFSEVTIPDHLCGWSNIAHGGVLTTILDENELDRPPFFETHHHDQVNDG